jgi:RES domain-containing protein
VTQVYRVLRKPYAQAPFDGEGAYRYGGRWSSPGTRLSYASEHQSLAMLEYFVHLDVDDPPPDLVLAVADIPDEVSREHIDQSTLPQNWRETPAPAELTKYGDDFAWRAESCVLIVPSALATSENNWLLNPQHPDFRTVDFRGTEQLSYDARLFHRERRGHKRK